MSELERATRNAYALAAPAWAAGPERVYGPLASALLDHAPVPLDGALVLDVGAGTGALARAAAARGATCVESDVAVEMLAGAGDRTRVSVAADGRRLPLRNAAFDLVTANCSLSHVPDPDRMVTEARRVLRSGGGVAMSAFANTTASHPAWAAVEAVLTEFGYTRPVWYQTLKQASEPQVGSAGALRHLATAAGLRAVRVDEVRVDTGVAAPDALVEWRLGMAQHADFLASLTGDGRDAVRHAARERIGADPASLGVDLLVLSART